MITDYKKAWLEKHGGVIFNIRTTCVSSMTGRWTSHGGAKISIGGIGMDNIRDRLYNKIKEQMYLECVYHEAKIGYDRRSYR